VSVLPIISPPTGIRRGWRNTTRLADGPA
jgi:2,4-dienoyl-CoA reductase-like NADH-dependent reductase (Old Yellow Enzyme family)